VGERGPELSLSCESEKPTAGKNIKGDFEKLVLSPVYDASREKAEKANCN